MPINDKKRNQVFPRKGDGMKTSNMKKYLPKHFGQLIADRDYLVFCKGKAGEFTAMWPQEQILNNMRWEPAKIQGVMGPLPRNMEEV